MELEILTICPTVNEVHVKVTEAFSKKYMNKYKYFYYYNEDDH